MTDKTVNSPLIHQVKAIFIHVTDMPKAVEWYSGLLSLDITYEGTAEDRTVYNIELGNGVPLLLDSMGRDRPSPSDNPLFMFKAPDLIEAYEFLRGLGIQAFIDPDNPVTEADRLKDQFHFIIRDPFGNAIIIHKGN